MIYGIVETEIEDGPIKIGYAGGEPFEGEWRRSLIARLGDHQIGNPRKLGVISLAEGGRHVERCLHLEFDEWRVGGEWFRREGKVLEWVTNHQVVLIEIARRRGVTPKHEQFAEAQRRQRELSQMKRDRAKADGICIECKAIKPAERSALMCKECTRLTRLKRASREAAASAKAGRIMRSLGAPEASKVFIWRGKRRVA